MRKGAILYRDIALNNWNGIASLFIACIELVLLINIFIFSDKNKSNNLAKILIVVLMIYQAMEFLICGLNYNSPVFAYFAFADISLLPPLGLYFVLVYYDKLKNYHKLIFIPASFFIVYYAMIIPQFNVELCTPFYAVYNYPLGDLYGFFYYSPILITMFIIFKDIRSDNPVSSQIPKVLLTGYVLVSLPVIVAFILAFSQLAGLLHSIVSVMCKFAVLLSIALTYFTLLNRNKLNKNE